MWENCHDYDPEVEKELRTMSEQPATPRQFRKKPVVIEAMQWHPGVIVPGACTGECRGEKLHLGLGDATAHVHTLEGTSYTLRDGDWVIRGVKGEYYPCKPDIFQQTYEPVETTPLPCERPARKALEHVQVAMDIIDSAKFNRFIYENLYAACKILQACPCDQRITELERDRLREENERLKRRELAAAQEHAEKLAASLEACQKYLFEVDTRDYRCDAHRELQQIQADSKRALAAYRATKGDQK